MSTPERLFILTLHPAEVEQRERLTSPRFDGPFRVERFDTQVASATTLLGRAASPLLSPLTLTRHAGVLSGWPSENQQDAEVPSTADPASAASGC